jgi:hypothetical protein
MNKKLLVIIGLSLLTLCLCILCFLLVYFFNSLPGNTPDPDIANYSEIPIEEYLGYEQYDIFVEDNSDVVKEITGFYDDMQDVSALELQLATSAQQKDPEDFFPTLSSYNQLLFKQVARTLALSGFIDGKSDSDSDPLGNIPFILNVQAKERFSYWYYVPIIGSLLKSKHQSIETARSGIYEYMSQELSQSERNAFLDEYGLNSIEDIKEATDTTVERLARDPELRAGINWTKIATDLGENAVIATTESIKIGPSRNPALSSVINGAVRIFTKSGQAVPNTTPVTILVPDAVVERIDQIMPEQVGSPLENITSDQIDMLSEHLQQQNNSMIVLSSSKEGVQYLDPGTWNAITAMLGALPVSYELNVTPQKTSDINIPYVPSSSNLLDPAIAMNLGFDVVIEQNDIVINSCLDLSGGISNNGTAEKKCKDDYEYCKRNQYTIQEGYSKCISAGGGCWDIGRWEYINDTNCPIDSNFNLNYEDVRLQTDYEYFGAGNKAYCECIVECRKEYWVKKDCSEQLQNCCESILD